MDTFPHSGGGGTRWGGRVGWEGEGLPGGGQGLERWSGGECHVTIVSVHPHT